VPKILFPPRNVSEVPLPTNMLRPSVDQWSMRT